MATETFGIINSLASATVEVNIYGYTQLHRQSQWARFGKCRPWLEQIAL